MIISLVQEQKHHDYIISSGAKNMIISLADMLSGTKIAGQLRKNSSGHAT